jgi:hypothetical protein
LTEQQKTDIAEETTTVTKEKVKSAMSKEKEKEEQDNAAGIEQEHLK